MTHCNQAKLLDKTVKLEKEQGLKETQKNMFEAGPNLLQGPIVLIEDYSKRNKAVPMKIHQ